MNAHDEAVFRSAVAHVLSVGGPEILSQPDRFASMLSDMLGAQSGQLRAERSAVVFLVREGLAREAVSGQLTPSRRTELIARSREDGGLDDPAAHAAVIALEEAGTRKAIGGTGQPVAAAPSPTMPPTSAVSAPPPHQPPVVSPPQPVAAAAGWDDPTPLAPATSAATAPNTASRPAYPEATPGPGTPGQRGDSRARGAWALVGVGALLFAGVIALIVVLLASDNGNGGSVASPGTLAGIAPGVQEVSTTLPTTTTTLDPVAAARQANPDLYTAMVRFDDIIQQSTEGRAAVGPLVRGVRDCSISPQEASQQIDDIVANRQSVLNQVNAVSTTTSPQAGQLARQLQTAIEESISADRHYSNWMTFLYRDYYYTDPIGCPDGSAPVDDEFAAGDADSEQATAAKEAFVAAYNPVAESLGLRTWAEEQI
jgi:hypothetical protein